MPKFGTDLLAHTTTQGSKSRIRLDDDLRNVLARYQVQRDDPKKVGAEKNRRNGFNAFVMDGPAQIAMLYAAANFLSNSGND